MGKFYLSPSCDSCDHVGPPKKGPDLGVSKLGGETRSTWHSYWLSPNMPWFSESLYGISRHILNGILSWSNHFQGIMTNTSSCGSIESNHSSEPMKRPRNTIGYGNLTPMVAGFHGCSGQTDKFLSQFWWAGRLSRWQIGQRTSVVAAIPYKQEILHKIAIGWTNV